MFFDRLGFSVTGADNNMRADFFGPQGDTTANRRRLETSCRNFRPVPLDIRDRPGVDRLFREGRFELVIHTAAQPSHELAAARPFDDFDVNAGGTLNLLEACRQHAPEAVFILMSTNKVYGDGPNHVPLVELERRWDFADEKFAHGIPETFPVDHTTHSLYGVSKLSGDILTQEYGRYFGMNTGVFRGGCLTGPFQAGVELHGFFNYLVNAAVNEKPYTIYGYKGKQVRDQIYSQDVVAAFWEFAQNPRPGEVYNLGGGKENSASLLECVDMIAAKCGKKPRLTYSEQHRIGDHMCYYSDLRKFRSHYPNWKLSHTLPQIVEKMVGEMSGSGS
jgi:CDP-paratose 2-epimerase